MYDKIFYVLAHEHRRQLLQSLKDHNPQTEIPAIDAVLEENSDEDTLRVKMVHIHLPMLEDCKLIKWDQANHRIKKGPNFEKIRWMLEAMPNEFDSG